MAENFSGGEEDLQEKYSGYSTEEEKSSNSSQKEDSVSVLQSRKRKYSSDSSTETNSADHEIVSDLSSNDDSQSSSHDIPIIEINSADHEIVSDLSSNDDSQSSSHDIPIIEINSADHEIVSDLSSNDDSESSSHDIPIIKTPQKKKRPRNVQPISDDGLDETNEIINDDPHHDHIRVHEETESDQSDNLCETLDSEPDSICHSVCDDLTSEESLSEDSSVVSDPDDSPESLGELPLYPGSTFTSSNFDALLLAYFKRHHVSEAAKEDLLKLLELALPDGNNTATSSYKFNKRHEDCLLPYKLMELCPTCHQKVERQICHNSECVDDGLQVDPVRFFVIPLKPQIQRLIKGKN